MFVGLQPSTFIDDIKKRTTDGITHGLLSRSGRARSWILDGLEKPMS